MPYRYFVVILLMSLVLGVSPASAAVTPIDPTHPPAPLLEPAELQKLAALRNTYGLYLASEVSPDDTAVVAVGFPEASFSGMPYLAFLNLNDGSSTSIHPSMLDMPPATDIVWRDDHTAVYVSFDQTGSPLLVTLDRASGNVETSPLQLPGFPLSIAPNAARLLIFMPPTGDQSATTTRQRGPHAIDTWQSAFNRLRATRSGMSRQGVQLASSGEMLAAFDLTTHDVVPLVTLPPGSITLTGLQGSTAWTPDGSKLAIIRTTIPVPGTEGTDVFVQEALGRLSPAQNPFFQGNVVDVVDFAHDDIRPAALKAADGDGHVFNQVAWSPDGQSLLVQVGRPSKLTGRPHPIYQKLDRSALRFYDAALHHTATLDRPEIEAPTTALPLWASPDEIVVRAPDGLSERLYRYNRVSGDFHRLPTDEGTFGTDPHVLRMTHHSRQIVAIYSSFQRPQELYRIEVDDGAMEALTQFNAAAAAVNEIRADKVTFRLKGGVIRMGYLIQPATASFPPRDVPIVVYQQGGPGLAMTNRWGTTAEEPFNLLPNFGIAVLFMPFSGREGIGPEFYNAMLDGRNFGQVDVDEAAQAVQYMLAHGYTSQGRVGITGSSYGGYFTSQSITRYPDLYAAANSQATPLDLFAAWQSGRWRVPTAYWEGRTPEEAPAEYTKDSPLYQAAKVKTPLLLFHGTDDSSFPASIAVDFHNQVAANGTPVEMLLFQGEGHGIGDPSNHFTAAQAQINWFRTYLAAPDTK